MPPALACGDNNNLAEEVNTTQKMQFDVINLLKNEGDNNSCTITKKKACSGIVAKKDLTEVGIQRGLFFTKKYCTEGEGILKATKIVEVNGMQNVLSYFGILCEGASTCGLA